MPGRSRPGAEHTRPDRPLWVSVAVLGLVTNVAYGVAYYSYGVLIDPINKSTGWSPAALGATFSAVLVIGGVGGLAGGRLVDRLGPRPAFLIAAALGAAGLAIASVPSGLLAFAVPSALGCGVISALGFYHITQGRPNRPNCEVPWTQWTRWTHRMLSRVLSRRAPSTVCRRSPTKGVSDSWRLVGPETLMRGCAPTG